LTLKVPAVKGKEGCLVKRNLKIVTRTEKEFGVAIFGIVSWLGGKRGDDRNSKKKGYSFLKAKIILSLLKGHSGTYNWRTWGGKSGGGTRG